MSACRNIISFAEAKHHIKNGKKGGKKENVQESKRFGACLCGLRCYALIL